jgi:hypothetical protein
MFVKTTYIFEEKQRIKRAKKEKKKYIADREIGTNV